MGDAVLGLVVEDCRITTLASPNGTAILIVRTDMARRVETIALMIISWSRFHKIDVFVESIGERCGV